MPQAPYRMAWFNLNFLTINPGKTQALVLGPIASKLMNLPSESIMRPYLFLDKLAVGKAYRMSGRQQQ